MIQTQVLESSIELPKSFQPLQSLVESAYQQKNDPDFFQLLCESIMSLLQTFPLLGSLRARWQEEERTFEKELRLTEDLAKRQVRKTYAFFLELLKKEEYRSISGFEEGLKRVDDLLENREIHYDGREYEKAYDVLCRLCSVLFKHGKLEVIKDFVTIESRIEYGFEGNSYLPKSIPFISGYCFGPAVRKMQAMLASWNQKNQPDWMIWKRLCNAAWAWNASMDIFTKKEPDLTSPILRKRSNREKGISIDIKEMHALKTGKIQKPNSDCYFSKDRFQSFLKIIIQRIAVELAQNHTEVYDHDEIYVHAMELEKTGNEFWIKIEWKEGLSIEQFCLKSNIQRGKITDQFIDMLMKAAPNSTFPVPDRSPADLIQRCHLKDGGLKELFFGDCTKKHVTFKGTRIEGQFIKKEKLANLLAYLQFCHKAAKSPIRFN
jgi:hypothetical protein